MKIEAAFEALKETGGLMWKRPDDLVQFPFPNVWRKFKAESNDSREGEVEYIIKDIPEARYADALNFLTFYALKHKPLYKALGK